MLDLALNQTLLHGKTYYLTNINGLMSNFVT